MTNKAINDIAGLECNSTKLNWMSNDTFCAVMPPDLPTHIYFANPDGYIFRYDVYRRASDKKIQVVGILYNGAQLKIVYDVDSINMQSKWIWLPNRCVKFYTSKFEAMLHMKHKNAKQSIMTFVQYGYSDTDIERMFIAEENEYCRLLDERRWRDIQQHTPIPGEKCTYVMYDGSALYKIGRSVNPNERLRSLCTANPSLQLIMVCNADIECTIHKLFTSKRVKREWFKLDQNDMDLLLSKYGFQKV